MDKPTLIKGTRFVDDRGVVTYCNDFDMSEVKRWYMLENWREGFIRAWHGHIREAKWIMCVSGVAIECVAEMVDTGEEYYLLEPDRYTLHPNGDVLYVPPGYANGHKNLVQGTRLIHFSNLLHEDTKGDDVRFDYRIHGWVWEEEYR